MGTEIHSVSGSTTIVFALLLAALILALALEEKIHAKKSLITGTFAIICIFLADLFGILPLGPIENSFHELIKIPVFIPGIDWEVISIIVGSSLFVDVTSRSGLFSWMALKLTKFSRGDPQKLLAYYAFLTVVFSAFLNNVTAMIIIGSLTAVSLKRLEKQSYLLAFLLIEGSLTNVGGLLTLVSSVPNIIVGNTAKISFMSFLIKSAPFVVLAGTATVILGKYRFQIPSLHSKTEKKEALELVMGFDENDAVKSKRFFYISAVSFVLLVGLFATTANIPYLQDLGLGFVALSFGMFVLWAYKHEVDTFYSGLDWDLIFFFIGLFIVINTMEHAGVLSSIGMLIEHVIALGPQLGTCCLLWVSAVTSSVTDNIPLAAVLAKVLAAKTPVLLPDSSLWWSVIFGANLGGNFTPIGLASTVVAVTIMHKHKLNISFLKFVKVSLPFAVMQLSLASVYVLWILS